MDRPVAPKNGAPVRSSRLEGYGTVMVKVSVRRWQRRQLLAQRKSPIDMPFFLFF